MKQITADSWINALSITLLLYGAGAIISGIIYLLVGIATSFDDPVTKVVTLSMAVLALVFGPLLLLWGKALWERKQWSRILVLVAAGISALTALFMIIGGVVLMASGEPRSELLGTLVIVLALLFGGFVALVIWLFTNQEIVASFKRQQLFAWNDQTRVAIVRAWAILTWISAGALALLGVVAIIASPFVGSLAEFIPVSMGTIIGALIVVALLLFALAVLMHFIAKGLWEFRNWARIVMIVLAWVSIVFSIVSFIVVLLQFASVMGDDAGITALNVADSLANLLYGAGLAALEIWFLMNAKDLFRAKPVASVKLDPVRRKATRRK